MDSLMEGMKGVILDIDGTLFRGDEPLVDLVALFSLLNKKKLGYVVATNNTKSARSYQQKFKDHGLHLSTDHIFTCTDATADYLKLHYPKGADVFVIGKEALKEEIAQRGFQILSGRERDARVVVVGGDFDLTYEKLKNAVLHIQEGARLIGTNPDMLIPTEEGLVPEAGTTLAAIEAATGSHPIIIGKPEPILFEMAVAKMGLSPKEVIMIGDRLDTDIKGAKQAGLYSLLVETGVDSRKSVVEKGIHPYGIIANLDEFMKILKESR